MKLLSISLVVIRCLVLSMSLVLYTFQILKLQVLDKNPNKGYVLKILDENIQLFVNS